jgi:antitoxin component YwqK of YwqJK toxin-antitoxin module
LIYEGGYKNGQREGKGKLINKDGTISYEGDFHDGLPNGSGKSFKNGSILHEGRFIDGISE